jgi:hypothetical protein
MIASDYQNDSESASNDVDSASFEHDPLPEKTEGLEIQGGRLTYRRPIENSAKKGGGLRGRVRDMSSASRRRLMAKFASLDWARLIALALPFHFITLTTPEPLWGDEKGVYMALRDFRRALFRVYGPFGFLGAFVRRERGEKRGMLHYHVITVGAKGLTVQWVRDTWTKALSWDSPVRVDVQLPEDPNRVAKYLSKYCSKAGYDGKLPPGGAGNAASSEQRPATPGDAPLSEAHNVTKSENDAYTGGRWWYIWGAETLLWAPAWTITGPDGAGIAKRVRRIFRRWRVQVSMRRADAMWKDANGQVLRSMRGFCSSKWSVNHMRKYDGYSSQLAKSGGGFTFLLAPDLLEKMLDAAAYGYEHINAGVPF